MKGTCFILFEENIALMYSRAATNHIPPHMNAMSGEKKCFPIITLVFV